MESNISGLLGMSGSRDSDDDYSSSNGYDYNSRRDRQRKHYIESGYKTKMGIDLDMDTGEILNFKPKRMAYTARGRKMPQISMPDLGKILPLAMYAGIGLIGYKVYKQFFGQTAADVVDDKADKGSKAVAALTVDANQAKANAVQATAASLQRTGLNVSDSHKKIADWFNEAMDSWWVDTASIVKTILGQNIQTFRLVSVAYGARTLKQYCDYHISAFASKARNEPITFADSLKLVLSKDELKKIHGYISMI